MSDVKLLSTRRVAEILGFQPRTITRWCREGVFPEARLVGRVWRVPNDDPKLQMMLYLQEEKRLRADS